MLGVRRDDQGSGVGEKSREREQKKGETGGKEVRGGRIQLQATRSEPFPNVMANFRHQLD